MVADDAAQQAVVVGANPVVVVDAQRRECRHKEAELLLLGDEARELGIKAVNAFHEQDITFLEFEFLAQVFPLALDKVVGRHIDFLAGEQVGHVLVELFQVEGIKRLVVIVTGLVARRAVTVHEIVVKFNNLRYNIVCNQLDSESF